MIWMPVCLITHTLLEIPYTFKQKAEPVIPIHLVNWVLKTH